MPATSAQRPPRKMSKRHQPYSSRRSVQDMRCVASSDAPGSDPAFTHADPALGPEHKPTTESSQSPVVSVVSPAPLPPPTRSRLRPMRDVLLQIVHKAYPYYVPKDDLELLSLSNGRYNGPASGLQQFLKEELVEYHEGGYEASLAKVKEGLNELIEATGLKPSPGDPNVFVRPIPGSEFSVRLFPGCTEAKEYCLDFVRTATGEAVNSPFPKFELFSAPGPDAPVGSGPVVSATPLECAFGMPRDQIPPGEEKFVMADGTTCILRRPGYKDVRFTIPIRKPRNPPSKPPIDADILELPQYVEYD